MEHRFTFSGSTGAGNTIDAVSRCAANITPDMNHGVSRRTTGSNVQFCGTSREERLSMWDILTAYSAALSGGALE